MVKSGIKIITIVFALLCIVLVSLFVSYDRLEQSVLPKTNGVFVLSAPDDFAVEKNKASYQGPHPRLLSRPQETFDFPITLGESGPINPLFAGQNQYPFICDTQHSGLGQPLVDNQQQQGVAVFANSANKQTEKIVGYSQDCSLPTQVTYYIKRPRHNGFQPLNEIDSLGEPISSDSVSAALAREEASGSDIVRVETGTINRFIYVLALPVNGQDLPDAFNHSQWNQKLLYRFKGGIGVGRKQGKVRIHRLLNEHAQQLQNGYALAFSTGTQTSQHFDIWLSEDTALRVKHQFASQYGKPIYTIGIGGSGGAIQQYLLAQNRPGIIDAAVALYAYPDMVTQVNHALDCELLEYYFDETSPRDYWQQWSNRPMVQGSHSLKGFKNRYGYLQGLAAMMHGDFSKIPAGASECSNGWRGVSHYINNPAFSPDYSEVAPSLFAQTDWSHWGDVHHIYGTDENGFGRRFWGNEGVQYGLRALRNGTLAVPEFISLNQKIGGWKPPANMQNEHFWHISGDDSLKRLSLWGEHNMTHEGKAQPARRSQGDEQAAMAAYNGGLVFLGVADIPIVDLRHYRDHQLDMHHTLASFVIRKRIQNALGDSDHQLIWMMEKDDELSRSALLRSLPIDDALQVLDQWLVNIQNNPQQDLAANRPANARDRCYDKRKRIIDDSLGTWDGQWNQKENGPCQARFPHHTQSRFMAGESMYADTLYCHKQSIANAITQGEYGTQDMRGYQSQLEQIFPNGVCQYQAQANPKVATLVKQLVENPLKNNVAQYRSGFLFDDVAHRTDVAEPVEPSVESSVETDKPVAKTSLSPQSLVRHD